ncbi:MAG: hypothetical protein AAGU19_21375, partial [Prolixibacteraceae bacterium]
EFISLVSVHSDSLVYLPKIGDKMVNPSVNSKCEERLAVQLQGANWSITGLLDRDTTKKC